MKLYVARHGETTWNVENRVLGNTPGELTEKGRMQAAKLARAVQKLRLDKAYASDLTRVQSTIAAVRQAIPALSIDSTPLLRERNFGELEGKLMSDIDWEAFWTLPDDEAHYGAESLADFTRRIARFVVDLSAHEKHEAIALFTHIGVMNRLNYLSNPTAFTFMRYPNADVTEFDFESILHNSRHLTQSYHYTKPVLRGLL